jgi:TPR repeat protein
MFELGWAYETGLGTEPDLALAARWYRQAAEAGNLMAMNNLGWLYAQGNGVERDPGRAVELYRTAADGGVPIAMGNLGWMLENGIGAAQDLPAAATWYRAAAMQGEPQSMLNLGNLFLLGDGVDYDPATALQWFARAREAGRVEALSYMGEVYETTPEFKDPERAAWLYIRALQAGDGWPASRAAREWDRETARAVQVILKDNGYYTGPIDGVMGGGSRAAMEAVLAGAAEQ